MSEEQMTVEEYLSMITSWPEQARLALARAENTAELVDIVGELHTTASRVGAIKRRAASEVESGDVGRHWQMTQGRKAKRTFNSFSLLLKFQQKWRHKSTTQTIGQLVDEGVLTLTWKYTELMKLASEYGIEISRVSNRSISSGDEYDMGEDWVADTPHYEPVQWEE